MPTQQQTVLLLGGTGRTGRRALQQLLDRRISVRAIVRSRDNLPPDVAGNPNLTVIECELVTNPKAWVDWQGKLPVVVNVAGEGMPVSRAAP